MSRFERPVQGARLLATPEMQVVCPALTYLHDGTICDEGCGCKFDRADPYAYAERWFALDGTWESVTRWYRVRLEALGWSLVSPPLLPIPPRMGRSTMRSPSPLFTRDGELFGLARVGAQVRVHYEVAGSWPDDTTGLRSDV